ARREERRPHGRPREGAPAGDREAARQGPHPPRRQRGPRADGRPHARPGVLARPRLVPAAEPGGPGAPPWQRAAQEAAHEPARHRGEEARQREVRDEVEAGPVSDWLTSLFGDEPTPEPTVEEPEPDSLEAIDSMLAGTSHASATPVV